ncbi:cytochrome b-c1 complex subunit 2, mitochondrial-like isoform X1 [Hyposmocoma kahamanoa]|uniref:cytochrome b-c1 complex subunit 2, mitochondrial-like isoform X1 n=1 Tax=Hyposmocoma kahamanoa TaxID=1477025 RepID=UPI000E6D6D26|nr:cytochrome b-c1 complex subunit 2, mitochondrial-like isoform X1 [Hyposmocoma kahamanoa]
MYKLSLFYNNLHTKSYSSTLIRRFSRTPNKNSKLCGWPKSDYGPVDVHRSSFLNGLKVAAVKPMGAQICCCTVMFSVGSRCEADDELGVSHFLRTASSLTGCSSSGFIRSRLIQEKGAYLSVNSDRQTVCYTLRCPYYLFNELKCYLLDCGPRNFYLQHELDEIMPCVHEDLYRISPEQRVMDLIQKACFTGGLSNSVYCEESRIYDMTTDTIDAFVNKYFQPMTCTIGSYGVPFEEILKMASMVDSGKSNRPKSCKCPQRSNFRSGFESYDLGIGAPTYVAIAVPSCGTCDFSTLLAYSILAHSCGAGNSLTPGCQDLTPQTPLSLLGDGDPHTEFKAFNISYMECGIFGILIKSPSETIRCAAFRAAEFLFNLRCIDCNTIEIGRRRLKVGLNISEYDCMAYSEGLALQIANDIVLDSAKDFSNELDRVSVERVRYLANAVSYNACNMGVAVVGDVGKAPHDGELRRSPQF